MESNPKWRALGWRHMVWELVRFYRSHRGKKGEEWLRRVERTNTISVDDGSGFPIDAETIALVRSYLESGKGDFDAAFSTLRTEEEALSFCDALGVKVGTTATRSKEHHQSSKALVAAVSEIAERKCRAHGLSIDSNPQRRAIWCNENGLHVSARNVDGVVPGLMNPVAIWEIKEYWGKTAGGSKMSDAVYECQLVGRELLEFEERSKVRVEHVVFLDGRDQWNKRKSDLVRFIDLFHQGIIDRLFIGTDVETGWEETLESILSDGTS